MRLTDNKSIVTGGGSGIGRAIARGLASEGAAVVVVDLHLDRALETVESIRAEGRIAHGMQADIGQRQQVETVISTAVDQLGGLDTLVCSAGISPLSAFLDISEDEWDRVLEVNLKGLFLCGQAAARHMKDVGGGSIINVTSQLCEVAQPNSVHYAASKGGGKMLTKAMALDLSPFGIRVNAIAPGLTNTNMTRLETEEGWAENKQFIPHIPMGRPARPEEMVGAAVFLASEESSYVNGATILVDGGYLAV
jgi:NAD(P)-dependent dehydrogenase (short-subunit alcohol dehydrogenase family)